MTREQQEKLFDYRPDCIDCKTKLTFIKFPDGYWTDDYPLDTSSMWKCEGCKQEYTYEFQLVKTKLSRKRHKKGCYYCGKDDKKLSMYGMDNGRAMCYRCSEQRNRPL